MREPKEDGLTKHSEEVHKFLEALVEIGKFNLASNGLAMNLRHNFIVGSLGWIIQFYCIHI